MFKISIVDNRNQRKLVVEGKLSEPWVDELRTTWRNASRDLNGRKVVVNLAALPSSAAREKMRFSIL
jgi:hypothetical protein